MFHRHIASIFASLVRASAASSGFSRQQKRRGAQRRQLSEMECLEPRLALSAASAVQRNFGSDAVPDNARTREVLFVGGARSNTINFSGDSDWYRISLQAGRTYRFNMNGTPTGFGSIPALYDPYLNLRLESGTIVASNDDTSGRNSQITYSVLRSGTFFVDARAFGRYTGGYTVTATDVTPADDYAANTGTSGEVIVDGANRIGVVNNSGDRDWFRVYLVAGRTYRIDLNGGTLSDPLLRMRNTNGSEVASNDDFPGQGRNSRIVYRATSTGFHYVDAGGFASNTGSYVLRVMRV